MYVTQNQIGYSTLESPTISTITLEEKRNIERKLIKQILGKNQCKNSILIFEDLLQSFLNVHDNNIDKLVDASDFHTDVSINKEQSSAISLLQISICTNKYEYAKIILEKSANPDAQMLDGSTALHLAVKQQKKDFVSLLLSNNASTIIYDNNGCLPIHIVYDNKDIIKLLVKQNNNDINQQFPIKQIFYF